MFKGIRVNGKIVYEPQEKQKIFHNAIKYRDELGYRDFLYGGSAKGGKSYALRWEAHRNCLEHPGIKGLLIRSSFPELERTHLRELVGDLPLGIGRYNAQRHTFYYANGSILEFGYGSTIDDFSQYLSANYDFIMIDELTTIPFYLSYMLRMRLQATKENFTPFWACATNPGNKAHAEVKAYFVTKTADRSMYPNYDPKRVCFIPATVFDNQILINRDPEVVERLQQLPYNEQQKYLYGNWDIFEGVFFEDFQESYHVIDKYEFSDKKRTIGGLDYGNVTCLHVLQRDFDGTITVAGECYLNNLTNPTDRAIAISEYLLEKKIYGLEIIYDTDMDISQMSNIGIDKTPISIFREVTIQIMGKHKSPRFRPVHKRSVDQHKNYRVVCNEAVKDYLKIRNVCPKCYKYKHTEVCKECNVPTQRQAKLFITNECKELIKFFKEAIYDPTDRTNSDFDRSQIPKNDHAYDSFKYAFMELYTPKPKIEDNTPLWLKRLFENAENKFPTKPVDFMGV